MESDVQSSLRENCHQVIYAKFNLKISYPPPYEWEIWYYQKASLKNIRKAIDQFPWIMRFTNINVNKKVNLFNKTVKFVKWNYIPSEKITCDERDSPWINKDIKELIAEENQAYKSYRHKVKFNES